MFSHSQIIDRSGGYRRVAEILGEPVQRVRFWHRRGSIPASIWADFAAQGMASLEELAAIAPSRKQSTPASGVAA